MTLPTQGSNLPVPAINLPIMYVNFLGITGTTNTTVTLTGGQCRDSSNVTDISLPNASYVVNFAVNGINGLDAGAIAVATPYAIYAIQSSKYNTSGFIASASFVNPLMPEFYDSFRYVGTVATLSGAATIIPVYQTGSGSGKVYTFNSDKANLVLLSAGASTTFATVSAASALVPPSASALGVNLSFTPNAAGDKAFFRTTGSTLTTAQTPQFITGQVAAVLYNTYNTPLVLNASRQFDYAVTSGSDSLTIYLNGFTDQL
jgi:hypothetical protein